MALLKRNLYRGHRAHFAPGEQQPPTRSVLAVDYVKEVSDASQQQLSPALPWKTTRFPLKRSKRFAMAPVSCNDRWQYYHFPQHQIWSLPLGRVLEEDGIVVTASNQLLADTAVTFELPLAQHRIFGHHSLSRLTYINKRVAVIASADAHVYFHWMCNILPRLELLQQSGQEWDQLYLPALTQPFQWQCLQHLGVDFDKVIMGARGLFLEAEQLIVPSLPAYPCDCSPFVTDYLRKSFGSTQTTIPHRHLYVRRHGSRWRQLVNEDELVAVLHQRGFESVTLESLTVQEQAELFSTAAVIIAPHGAGLTNLVFCQPTARLIEIFHPKWICDCYWQVSQHLGFEHHLMVGKSVRGGNHNFVVNIPALLDKFYKLKR